MPGIAASTSETWLLGSPPNSVDAPENSLEFEVTWAWTSSPITISQSPVAPFISFALVALMLVHSRAARRRSAPTRFQEIRPQPVCLPGGTNSRHCRNRLRHGAERHEPRQRQGCLRPERSCAPRPNCPGLPTTERQAAGRDRAPARRLKHWL